MLQSRPTAPLSGSRPRERTVNTKIRKALKKFGLPATDEPFERAYNYVAENYETSSRPAVSMRSWTASGSRSIKSQRS
jgi:hypothetical protein